MKRHDIKPKMKVWSMIGSRPEEFEVYDDVHLIAFKVREEEHYHRVWLKNRRTLYQRHPEEICKSKLDLRILVFGS